MIEVRTGIACVCDGCGEEMVAGEAAYCAECLDEYVADLEGQIASLKAEVEASKRLAARIGVDEVEKGGDAA